MIQHLIVPKTVDYWREWSLDPELTLEVLDVIRRVATDDEVTLIIVTHEIGFAREVADRVLFMYEGRAVEEGSRAMLTEPSDARTAAFLRAALR